MHQPCTYSNEQVSTNVSLMKYLMAILDLIDFLQCAETGHVCLYQDYSRAFISHLGLSTLVDCSVPYEFGELINKQKKMY